MKLLLADDDNDDIELFQEAVSRVMPAAEIVISHNGRELLSSLQSIKPDAIFLDINMPEMNGWECLRILKNDATTKQLPVVIYTTSSSQGDREFAKELGAWRFITKPDRFSELVEILSETIKEI